MAAASGSAGDNNSNNNQNGDAVEMRSGLFGVEGLEKEAPCNYLKITEGTAAVLFPPAAINAASRVKGCGLTANGKEGPGGAANGNNSAEGNATDDDQAVFYNPAQVVNRDLSVCVLACFSRLRSGESPRKGGTRGGITILEALSATGLRAIRYYKEISGVRFIIANDIDADAVDCIRRNCEFNGVPCVRPTMTENFSPEHIRVNEESGIIESGGAVIPNLDDANDLMFRLSANPDVHTGRRLFAAASSTSDGNINSVTPLLQQELMDVVDLDPYGSASPFLDAAMRCIKEGGMLLVTSTDSAILCGNYPDTCHAKYNTVPTKSAAHHEMAVRILLAAIERVANKHRKYIVPMLSLHIDFYVRCVVRVYTQPAEVKLSPCKLGYLLQCSHCPSFWVRPMALTRPRSKKRLRENSKVHNNGGMNGGRNCGANEIISSGSDNIKGEKRKCSNAGNDAVQSVVGEVGEEEEVLNSIAEKLGKECFPAAPSRQENPKITCCSLQHMLPPLKTGCCNVCGAFVTLSGPIYAAQTQCIPFLTQVLGEIERRGAAKQITAVARVAGLVRVAMEELPETPLFFKLPDISSFVRVRCPPTPLFVGALGRMGYRCSQVHCAPSGIKTDCPPDVMVSVMLKWKQEQESGTDERDHGGEENIVTATNDTDNGTDVFCESGGDVVKKKQADVRPLLVTPLADANFLYDKRFDFRSSATGVAKFIPNAPHWGPKRRHQGALHDDDDDEDS